MKRRGEERRREEKRREEKRREEKRREEKRREEKRREEKSIVLLLIGCLAPCGELRLASRVLDGGLLPQLVTACTQTTGKLCSTSL
jgi:hypothetical protein